MLAVAHPWASASSYLSSQSLADSRCNTFMPPRGRPTLVFLVSMARGILLLLYGACGCTPSWAGVMSTTPPSVDIRFIKASQNSITLDLRPGPGSSPGARIERWRDTRRR